MTGRTGCIPVSHRESSVQKQPTNERDHSHTAGSRDGVMERTCSSPLAVASPVLALAITGDLSAEEAMHQLPPAAATAGKRRIGAICSGAFLRALLHRRRMEWIKITGQWWGAIGLKREIEKQGREVESARLLGGGDLREQKGGVDHESNHDDDDGGHMD
ncbi:hypothetical protein GUJ93_ZPchr0010g9961 [Zizania palustris]|uniref:Uncharacterized protein n=1 Tax=Zizania palustris TaxID=103762 RepID=A0A8J5WE43_ZIZPA|nr:hypothetical protein GUJ93_ZPchr0010g9961 [Zizania palustris]